jgi:hypothetical protein
MKERSVAAVVVLSIVTLGIYAIVWTVKIKDELNAQHRAGIPTAWLLLVPIVNLWWSWKWCGGIELATGGKLSQVLAFVVLVVLGPIGMAIVQAKLNEAITGGELGRVRQARAGGIG